MYTTVDKAIVALIMALVGIIGIFYHPFNISPDTVAVFVGILTPILVYLFPNLPKDTPPNA